jgi:hypothetical protein
MDRRRGVPEYLERREGKEDRSVVNGQKKGRPVHCTGGMVMLI